MPADSPAGGYPVEWEADVVLANGRPMHIRPIRPSDRGALGAFHRSLSEQTVYFRFFAPKPELSERELAHFTEVDYVDRVALVACVAEQIVGVGRYDRVDAQAAEVAFSIRDDYQGRGLGSIFLEHLAAAARERGIVRFIAEVLPANQRMLRTFRDAGYQIAQHLDEDVIAVTLEIEPTAASRAVLASREQRAEGRSVRLLLAPSSIAVVGASRRPGTVGYSLLRHLIAGRFTGRLAVVHPEASDILGVPCARRLQDLPQPVDLAVVAVPAEQVALVLADAAEAGVTGMVVVSGGFADAGDDGAMRQRALVTAARSFGIRIVGPNALGLVNTDAAVSMNASLVARMPQRGRIGFFSQSGALGASILERVRARGLGISTFVSAGNRADLSGNDVLQYWHEDDATDVAMLYLESIGNGRKFARLVRRMSIRKPVLMVRSAGSAAVPSGHVVRPSGLDPAAVEGLLAASGLVLCDGIDDMLDAAAVLSAQPMPPAWGRTVGPVGSIAIIGNSDALAVLAVNAASRARCTVRASPVTFARNASVERYRAEVQDVLADEGVAAVLVIHVPAVEATHDAPVISVMAAAAASAGKPVVAVMHGHGPTPIVVDGIPVFADVEDALRALAAVLGLARWRRDQAEEPVPPSDVDTDAMADQVLLSLRDGERELAGEPALRLLATGGLAVASAGAGAGPGLRLSLECDAHFGPIVRVGLDDPVATALGDVSVRLAPLGRSGAIDAVRALRALPAIMEGSGEGFGDEAPELIQRYADALSRLSWMHAWCPSIQQVDVTGLRWGHSWSADEVRVWLDPAPEDFDPQARRMGG